MTPPVRRRRADLVTVLVAGAGTALTSWAVASGSVGDVERAVFRLVNRWPDALRGPLWAVQTVGVLGMPLVVAIGALLLGRPRLAAALVLLVPLKLVVEHDLLKQLVGRGRPGTTIPGAILRGVPATGPSFPSGHAIIGFGLVVLLWPYLRRRWRIAVLVLAVLNALARVYLGGHAPLDVLGGAFAGAATAGLINLLVGVRPAHGSRRASPRSRTIRRHGRETVDQLHAQGSGAGRHEGDD